MHQEPFVGVLGFSQGGRVATGLMLDQQQQQRDSKQRKRKITGDLKFGVLTCPSYPPICPPETKMDATKILIPTVHLHGLSDPWLPQSRMLLENYYNKDKATVVMFEGQHHLPVNPADTEKLAKAILKVWNGVNGKEDPEDYEIP
jgi:predicted esterase